MMSGKITLQKLDAIRRMRVQHWEAVFPPIARHYQVEIHSERGPDFRRQNTIKIKTGDARKEQLLIHLKMKYNLNRWCDQWRWKRRNIQFFRSDPKVLRH